MSQVVTNKRGVHWRVLAVLLHISKLLGNAPLVHPTPSPLLPPPLPHQSTVRAREGRRFQQQSGSPGHRNVCNASSASCKPAQLSSCTRKLVAGARGPLAISWRLRRLIPSSACMSDVHVSMSSPLGPCMRNCGSIQSTVGTTRSSSTCTIVTCNTVLVPQGSP